MPENGHCCVRRTSDEDLTLSKTTGPRVKRDYPEHPIIGVGAVIVQAGRVLLVRRDTEPLRGEWSVPGGMLELGEKLRDGVRREVLEETGLEVETGRRARCLRQHLHRRSGPYAVPLCTDRLPVPADVWRGASGQRCQRRSLGELQMPCRLWDCGNPLSRLSGRGCAIMGKTFS